MQSNNDINITLAKTAGFCFGVDRAVSIVNQCVKVNTLAGKKTATLGPIIHNPQIVRELAERGIRIIYNVAEAEPGETVIIRSHGVTPGVKALLEQKGIPYIDATCPYVAKIHSIVQKYSRAGYTIFIAGDKDHPEVQGIAGYCEQGADEVIVFKDENELKTKFGEIITNQKKPGIPVDKPAILAAQTTFNTEIWKKCQKIIRKHYTNTVIFDTICNATTQRQSETTRLAKESDFMLVLGGRSSSNTRKLFEICKEHCPTAAIEDIKEIYNLDFNQAKKIGVTAGASTPAHIIEEVLNIMDDLLRSNFDETVIENDSEITSGNESEFAAMLEESKTEKIYAGRRIKGIVTSVSKNEVQLDIGAKGAGIIPADEVTSDPSVNPVDIVSIGDELEAVVMKVDDREGLVLLSKKQNDAFAGFDSIISAYEEDVVLEGVVTDAVRGGLLVLSNHVKVFIPASQSGLRRDESMESLLKSKVKFKVIELKEGGRRAVGSIRKAAQEEREKSSALFWADAEIGKIYTGPVKSLTSYGAFVDLGGVDGMIHITELTWAKVKHPSEVVKEGDVVTVYIKDITPETKRISLGYKKSEDDPWVKFSNEFFVGDKIQTKIVSLVPYGAFCEVLPGIDGLIHISEISHQRIAKSADVLSVGQEIQVEIIRIDTEKKKVSLSLKSLEPEEPTAQDTDLQEAAAAAGVTLTADDDTSSELNEAHTEPIVTDSAEESTLTDTETETEVSSATDSAEEKPAKPKRTRAKKTEEPKDETETSSATGSAEEKPAKPKRTRAKKTEEPKDETETSSATDSAEEKPAKPKRTRAKKTEEPEEKS
ncbi:MAG: bifunctional 4-hydroxy-3-methylbut-2-enyl diphosphate reductase/30S ribosomal protein S1 [Oscillospiraceae bacterium]|nr:bifunctional 4-hydroxy-3-methylbut-2-enyl diphosphate reductase/30S ribosomal protein S1 [Oscillospiraceae bacterium]